MLDNECVQAMFNRFQTILNELKSLGKTYENFGHINKILHSLPHQRIPNVTMLRASKNLDGLILKELVGILKVHEL